ncbi:MAG: [ribosomal protein S18]-alanine N-acetyltransferase [Clostridia bacterium]|nr:[ribosomal protein S18]-alanine N-acetyltransferase [Clostridia bacterium]
MIAEHLDQVLEIERVSFPSPWERSAFLNEIYNNNYAYYYVCLVEGKVCGYAGLWLILDEVHITNIAVHPHWRGRGLGKLLLDFLLHEAARLGADRVTLEVRVSNIAAQKLYERAGFTRAGVRKGYYNDTREDAIIMWKHLYGPELGGEEW